MKSSKGARKLKKRVGESIAKLLDQKPKKEKGKDKGTAGKDACAPSSQAIYYQPHRAKGSAFRDTRGDKMVVEESGALRAVTKPLSREKRKRLVRGAMREAKEQSRIPGGTPAVPVTRSKKKEIGETGKTPK
jgi:hypothetical protein